MSLLKKYTDKLLAKASAGKVIPKFAPGDTVEVKIRQIDGTTERVSTFSGVCLAIKRSGITSHCIVRKASGNVAVERTIMLFSPLVQSIQIVRLGAVRRAKILYLRELTGKRARIREDRSARAIRRKSATFNQS